MIVIVGKEFTIQLPKIAAHTVDIVNGSLLELVIAKDKLILSPAAKVKKNKLRFAALKIFHCASIPWINAVKSTVKRRKN